MLYTLVLSPFKEETIHKLNKIKGYEYHYASQGLTNEDYKKAEVILGNPSMDIVNMCPNLKWIQTDSAGVNAYRNLNPNITLSNAYGAYGEGISEYMLACVLTSDRELLRYAAYQKENLWQPELHGIGIANMHVLSIGMGSIGKQFLKKMKLLGAKTYGVTRTAHETPDYVDALYSNEELLSVLPSMDVIALSLPETKDTIHYIDDEKLTAMKQNAILINVGRGSAIDETALLRHHEKFSHIWLDVVEHEPLPKNSSLWVKENIHITPHISGRFLNPLNYTNVTNIMLENMKRYINNEELLHVIDSKIGY